MLNRIKRLISKIIYISKQKFSTIFAKLQLRLHNVKYGKHIVVRGKLFIKNDGDFTIGENVRINSADWANPIGGGAEMLLSDF